MRVDRNPADRIPELREALKNAGRDPASVPVSIGFAPADKAKLEALEEAGVSRAVFGVPTAPRDVVLRVLDKHVKVMESLHR